MVPHCMPPADYILKDAWVFFNIATNTEKTGIGVELI